MGYNPSSFPGGNDDPTLPKDSTFPHGSGHTDYGSGYPTQYAGSPRPSSLYPPPPPNNRPSRRGIVTIGFIIVLVLIIGVLAGKVLFTPSSQTAVVPTVAPVPPALGITPTTGQQCTGYFSTGKSVMSNIPPVSVLSNCVMIIDAYSGNIGGVTWNAGGVVAFGPGTYSGVLTDGEWLIVNASIANSKYCEKIHQLQTNGQAGSLNHPLDRAGWPPC